jgi:hypothetical protein
MGCGARKLSPKNVKNYEIKKERDFFTGISLKLFHNFFVLFSQSASNPRMSIPFIFLNAEKLSQDVYYIIFLKVAELIRDWPFFYLHVAKLSQDV